MMSKPEVAPNETLVLNTAHYVLTQIEAHPQFGHMATAQQEAVKQWVTVAVDAGVAAGCAIAELAHASHKQRASHALSRSAEFLSRLAATDLCKPAAGNGNNLQTLGQGE